MHKTVVATAGLKRAKARTKRNGKRSVKFARFALGDFVLVAPALQHPGKLSLRWKAPCRVVKVVSDHLLDVQQLVSPGETSLHHTSRLRMQFAFGDEGFYVEAVQDLRMSDGAWQVKVKWLSLDDLESSWEPALSIYEDVPVLFRRWAMSRLDDYGVGEMLDDMERAFGHPLYGEVFSAVPRINYPCKCAVDSEFSRLVVQAGADNTDLSPIENVWGALARKVYANGRQFETKASLKAQILVSWNEIEQEYLQDLIEGMPTRMAQVLLRHGNCIHKIVDPLKMRL
ncbi:hypothetical protein H257_05133 [Aphanomyces astaci]|uniref:Chromo domain-containing protein n=1 Tax=Aphanomyces astaci TaxID=112090 RepID=W4GS22_APHAT|nr:hypothetical protein H257_05133 [Aphanomyces astaci]ETV82530.1 hypothetical protein H257_05133 [Aphanomyces astaci]|eukprot:XP_009828199.1 hypothetical protein H257_05133 [Aphanomyces astaci]